MAILQFVLWTTPERPSINWKHDISFHRLESCSHISSSFVLARLWSAFSSARDKLLHHGHLGLQTWLSLPPDDVWLWAVTATAEKSDLLSSAPIVMLLLYQICIAHSEHCQKKKRPFKPRDFVLVRVSLSLRWRGPTDANHKNYTKGARKTRIYARRCRERSKRGKPGHGRRQIMSPCSHVPNPWHRWRWSHH